MKESVTYQAIVEEGVEKGRVQEARKLLLRIGTDQFGDPPNPKQLQEMEAITDVTRLEDLGVRVSHVENWSELLASSPTPRMRRRKKS